MKHIIATTGLDGLVGSRIRELLHDTFDFVNLHEKSMDITNKDSVNKAISKTEFDTFLHLAAFTNVDAAEENQETAYKVNVIGTQNVFNAVQDKGKKIMYMSTGFVFDGENPPYYEDSEPHPISYYGETKYEGEKIIDGKGIIIRIDYPYGGHVEYKKDIVESLIDLLQAKKPLSGVEDQILTPTFIDDIAQAVEHLALNIDSGLFHIVGADSLSGLDIIRTIGEVFDLDTSHIGSTSYEEFYKGKARRPQKSIMKSKKNTFTKMSAFRDGLERLKMLRYHKDL